MRKRSQGRWIWRPSSLLRTGPGLRIGTGTSTRRRIAFDLDETLGVPLTDGRRVIGWQMRPGSAELLDRLRSTFELVLWSVSPRGYVDKALAAGLGRWFGESHSWDEVPSAWKDVRQLRVDWLVDDSPHHARDAAQFGLASRYVVVPAYGSPEDEADPVGWVRLVEAAVAPHAGPGAAAGRRRE